MDNVIVKGILDEFCNNYCIYKGEDKAFETLINYLSVCRIQPEAVESIEQINSIDVDPGGNFGIDGVAIFSNDNLIFSENDIESIKSKSNNVHFIFTQGKTSSSINVGDISKFARAVQAFFKDKESINYSGNMLTKYNIKNKVFERDFSRNMSKDSPQCTLYYAYTGRYYENETVEEVIKQETQNISREAPFLKDVRIIIIDSNKIVSMYNDSVNAIEIDIEFKNRLTLDSIDNIDDVYYGFLNKSEFFKLIEDNDGIIRNNIFYENVRDYLGDENPVNEEIIKTLKDPHSKQYFPILNNGITIITRFIKPISSTKLIIKDYQIVNGCQTSNVLHRCKNYIQDSELSIPVKIIFTTDSNIINSIIRANNKQSLVPEEAFFTLSEYHKQLQEYYKQKSKDKPFPIYYERRSREIVNNSDLNLQKEQIITLHALIRAVTSVYYNAPHLVYSNNPNFILKMKYDFFSNNHTFSSYYVSSYMVAKIRQWLRTHQIPGDYHSFVFYIALYFRIFVTGSYDAYDLSNHKNDKFADDIISIMDNNQEVNRILHKVELLINKTITSIRNEDAKYSFMTDNQLAALSIFEDKMKEIYFYESDGHNVWPSDSERIIEKHPWIENCCVVGVKDVEAGQGEVVTAFIVIKQNVEKSAEQIIEELKAECLIYLPTRDVPLQYYVCSELPLSDVGKIDYRALEKQAEEMSKK